MTKSKKIIALIPARMGATRFPGKPLKKILELPLIEHVRRRALLCEALSDVYVATCDDEIKQCVESSGGKVIMTSSKHERCTDRIEEAARSLDADVIVNVQGDEPLVMPQLLSQLIQPLVDDATIAAACLIYPITNSKDLDDINTVKAVLDKNNRVLYFSRSPIPNTQRGTKPTFYEQSGLMAYTKKFLHQFSTLPQTPLERAESVDMLRIIEHGFSVYGVIVDSSTIEVDIPEHISLVENALQNDPIQKALYEKISKL